MAEPVPLRGETAVPRGRRRSRAHSDSIGKTGLRHPAGTPQALAAQGLGRKMVEAAGIEPASRDISARTSTRVVSLLRFARADSDDGIPRSLSRILFRASLSRPRTYAIPLCSAHRPSRERTASGGHLRQPLPSEDWQLLCARCFTRPPDNLGAPSSPQPARSNPFAPSGLSTPIIPHFMDKITQNRGTIAGITCNSRPFRDILGPFRDNAPTLRPPKLRPRLLHLLPSPNSPSPLTSIPDSPSPRPSSM